MKLRNILLLSFLALFFPFLLTGIQPSSKAYAQTSFPECWAVIVGVADYKDIDDLLYPDNDARDLYEQLCPVWGSDHIKLLVDSQASMGNIRDAICSWLGPREDADDVVLFFFSGHGNDRYISPYDSLTTSWANDIRDWELNSWLSTLDSEKVVVVLDSCESGGFMRNLSMPGRVILTSCAESEVSWEFGWLSNSVFSYYICEEAFRVLEVVDADGNLEISPEELFRYIQPRVVTSTQHQVQHPQLYDGYLGEFRLHIFTVPITFDTSAGGCITVDRTTYPPGELPVTFAWVTGTVHTVEIAEVVSTGEGIRQLFTSWSDGDTSTTRTLTSSEGVTYTASYETQYYLTVESEYGEPEWEEWHDANSKATFSVPAIVDHGDGSRHKFIGWSGDSTATTPEASVTMDSPKTVIANWQLQYQLTLKVTPLGITSVSGQGWYDSGKTVSTGGALEVVEGDIGTRYVFLAWEVDDIQKEGNPISVTMDSPHMAIASYETQHYLTIESEYGNPQGAGWHVSGSEATISVTSPVGIIIRDVFTKWTEGAEVTKPTTTVLVDKPKTITADWRTDYLQLYALIAGVLLIAGVILASVILKRKRKVKP